MQEQTKETVEKFNEAFGRGDADAVMDLMTDDCIFEDTEPAPDGTRLVGKEKVKAYWLEMFANGKPNFDVEELFVAGDRAVLRWYYRWAEDKPDQPGHVRGVDVIKVRDGKVAEKLSYVKG